MRIQEEIRKEMKKEMRIRRELMDDLATEAIEGVNEELMGKNIVGELSNTRKLI